MMSDICMRSVMGSGDFSEELKKELNILMRENRQKEAMSDREKELSMYRSGSAPPTVEGSLSAVGGLYGDVLGAPDMLLGGLRNNCKSGASGGGNGKGFVNEEELRSDPSYASYYYSNVNLNPRLPPPLVSKEDWRFTQRLGGGGSGTGLGGIGDKRKVIRNGDDGDNANTNGNGNAPSDIGFVGKEENGADSGLVQGGVEWGADGLIGLPGLGLGSRQKSLAEIIQDDMSHSTTGSRHPSRPASHNAFDNIVDSSESHFAHLHQELASSGQNSGVSVSHLYASSLGASLSKSTTPDPQLLARAPSPRIPQVGGGRVNSMDKRSVNSPSSFNGVSHGMVEAADLVASFCGMNLSANGMADHVNHSQNQNQHEIDDQQNLFGFQADHNHMKQQQYLNKPDSHKSAMSANAYLGGPFTRNLNSGGSSPSRSPNMANYGLGSYGINPASPPMMGSQLGNGNLPPLFENAAAASALGVAALDPRSLGGGLSLGPNYMGESQNLNRLGNHSAGNGLGLSSIDPLYLQYLRSNEYASAQIAALNESALDRDYMSGSYVDMLGLQKAYLGSLVSSQKSQYGAPYPGKSNNISNGYFGNPAFGLGMSYPGSPLAGPLLPNSPVRSAIPGRHGERNARFPSGMRSFAGGVMGAWHSEAGGNLDENFASTLLDEFKSNKTRCFELSEIASHVVEFSADQYGSRFIQQKLETATLEEKNIVFHEIMPQALTLMTDVFGNYVIQKFFEHGTPPQIRELADQLTGHVLTLSLQMYGCRVIQKAIEVVELDQQTQMVTELDGHVMRCVRDQNGNHVIQKCIECVPEDAIQFIVSTFYDQIVTLSTHPYGCRVIQRVLEHCYDPKTQRIVMDEILQSVCMLAQDQYGNYVVQHVLQHGKPHERSEIITKLSGKIVQMSQQKFASNVVEECLTFGDPVERQVLVNEMLGSTDENEPLQVMMKDQFANYVVQKVLETCDDQQLELILTRIKVHLNALKKYTYGKHIVARVEKLVAAGERRISIQAMQLQSALLA